MKKNYLFAFFYFIPNILFAGDSKISFWENQKRGTNFFNSVEKSERFVSAKEFGVQVVRLAPNKWLNGRPPELEGDFLIGRPDRYNGIIKKDLEFLKKILDEAHGVGMKVVLTMLSLPGGRWKQHNHNVEERKIWQDFKQQDLAISFWKDIATALKGHPAIVAYNIRNEPSPELVDPKLTDWYAGDYEVWYKSIKGTPADLNLFYRKAIKGIREIDPDIPIVLDTGFYSTAWGIKVMEPMKHEKVIYSFHMYEPYSFNCQFNKGKYKYPGDAPLGEKESAPILKWNKEQLKKYLEPVVEWQSKFHIPSNRIFIGEVGCFRVNQGCEDYLKDITSLFNEKKWHWAFYSFREDTWAGMDYELGTKKPSWKYWQAIESGKIPGPDVYKTNTLSKLLKKALTE